MAGPIKGTQYNKQQTEYQYFPEEYFSGSDVTIYFGDTFIDEVMSIECGLQERVAPVFGYNSFTFDAAARGQRIVQGSFTLAFKEAGYLSRVLDHVGQLTYTARPQIAYDLAEQKTRPTWLAGARETIEELLDRAGGLKPKTEVIQAAPNWPTMSLGSTGNSVSSLQSLLLTYPLYSLNTDNITQDLANSTSYGKNFRQRHADVTRLKNRLNEYLFESGAGLISKALNATQVFDQTTAEAVKLFQRHFSTSLAVDGIVGPATRAALNKGLSVTGTFDGPTKLGVMRLQRRNRLTVDGIFGEKSRKTLDVTLTTPNAEAGIPAETDYSRYEAEIWGNKSSFDVARKDGPFFYRGAKQEWLKEHGFDIFVNFGQLPQARVQNGKVDNYLTYNNTVKAIRNVHLTNVDTVIGPTGEAIAERYTFIAKDMD